MKGNAITTVDVFSFERLKKKAAARRRQRQAQRLVSPEKYERAKINNRLSTAKYDEKKRMNRHTLPTVEVRDDKKWKAASRWSQRQREKIAYFGLEVNDEEGKGAVSNKTSSSVLDST